MYKPELYVSHKDIKNEKKLIEKANLDKLYKPKYHISPKFGLLNDPNGLSYFNGEYHIFYQYHPNQVAHGLKNWNHLTTTNFIDYIDYGIAISPTIPCENYGIFSGGAFDNGEELEIYYTANFRDEKDNYTRKPCQVRALMNNEYKIISKEVIIDYNDKFSEHYRDPVRIGENKFLIGAQDLKKKGCLVIEELGKEFTKIMFENDIENSYMIECPNYFRLNGKEILIVSPQGINNDKFQNIHSVVYMFADLEKSTIIKSKTYLLDYGFDFYAPQVFDDGKQIIMIPWLGQADTIYPHEKEFGWSQVLGMPRVLTENDNILYQNPVDQYKKLRKVKKTFTQSFDSLRTFELEFKMNESSSIKIGNTDNYIILEFKNNNFIFNREFMDELINEEYSNIRRIENVDNPSIRMFVDNSVVEIFINDGRYTMSSRIFIKDINKVMIENIDLVTYYELKSINCLNN